jgi:hypothetical protein
MQNIGLTDSLESEGVALKLRLSGSWTLTTHSAGHAPEKGTEEAVTTLPGRLSYCMPSVCQADSGN